MKKEQKQRSEDLKRRIVGLRLSTPMPTRTCLLCQSPLEGRSDKKFCDDYCRNIHYHQNLGSGDLKVKRIHDVLRKNRKILIECRKLVAEGQTLPLESLQQRGYQFKYLTHMEGVQEGRPTYCCFDMGYIIRGKFVEIVQIRLPE
jgi:hypothetical protein